MFRLTSEFYEILRNQEITNLREFRPSRHWKEYELGRKTVFQSKQIVVMVEPGVSVVVGYGEAFSNQMPMYPHTYQRIPFENGQKFLEFTKSLYFDTDPLVNSLEEDSTLWNYMMQVILVVIEHWKCTHPSVYEELKSIEHFATQHNVPKERVYFIQCIDLDVLLRINIDEFENELTRIFRDRIWGKPHVEYMEWFEKEPELFEITKNLVEPCVCVPG